MKKLYYPIVEFAVNFKDGNIRNHTHRCNVMRYDIPNDCIENNYNSIKLEDFIKDYRWFVYVGMTAMRKRKYFYFKHESEKIFLDEIESIAVMSKHSDVRASASIRDIGESLPYEEFLQFVFDKEQELKSVVTSMSK